MDTNKELYEIELSIARSKDFDYTKKLVVFNVFGTSSILPIWHECDVLVCTKAGYLTEIEIKRSYADFLNDFKKEHDHSSEYIKNFYYCVPQKIKDKVVEFLDNFENRNDWRVTAGIIVYREDSDFISVERCPKDNLYCQKLDIEQILYLARLGSMRVMTLKKKILNLEKRNKYLNAIIQDIDVENEKKCSNFVIEW